MAVNQAVKEAKEQLHWAMEAKEEEDMWWWMEKGWEEWMSERDSVVELVDRKLAREALEHAMVEIQKKWYIVSFGFSLSWHSDFWLCCFLGVK